jgi:hypothetical protein
MDGFGVTRTLPISSEHPTGVSPNATPPLGHARSTTIRSALETTASCEIAPSDAHSPLRHLSPCEVAS